MPSVNIDILMESLIEAFETMAYMSPMPPDEPLPAPTESILATICFNGPQDGALELLAGNELAAMIAANIMGEDFTDPLVAERGLDAIKELINTTCGIIVQKLANSPKDVYNITVPQAQYFTTADQWEKFASQPGVVVLNVDGSPIVAKYC